MARDARAFDRRRFLVGAAGVTAAVAGGGLLGRAALGASRGPSVSPIQHVVVVMMENRSFDHFLGWLPGADGQQAGLSYRDRSGTLHSTAHLTDRQGWAHPDPDHSYEGGRAQLNDGRADGWLQSGANDDYAIGYYTRPDLPFLGEAAVDWTACDRFFSAHMGPTYPNRIYQHAGVTDRILNNTTVSTLPTIWDRLATAGLTGTYYYSDIPFLAIWGSKYVSLGESYPQFLADCAAGRLPNLAYVDPRFLGEDEGVSNDDHPHADILAGEGFMNQVYDAVRSSPAWPSTVLVYTYDEWGGFFDHVAPARTADVNPHLELRGFRIPVVVVSPFARRGTVVHNVLDATSILKLIETNWGLSPLSVRDANATSLGVALDLGQSNLSSPTYDAPLFAGTPCPEAAPESESGELELDDLLPLAQAHGWPIYGAAR